MQTVKASQATLTETQREQEGYHQCVVSSVGNTCVEGVYSCVTWYAAERVHSLWLERKCNKLEHWKSVIYLCFSKVVQPKQTASRTHTNTHTHTI